MSRKEIEYLWRGRRGQETDSDCATDCSVKAFSLGNFANAEKWKSSW